MSEDAKMPADFSVATRDGYRARRFEFCRDKIEITGSPQSVSLYPDHVRAMLVPLAEWLAVVDPVDGPKTEVGLRVVPGDGFRRPIHVYAAADKVSLVRHAGDATAHFDMSPKQAAAVAAALAPPPEPATPAPRPDLPPVKVRVMFSVNDDADDIRNACVRAIRDLPVVSPTTYGDAEARQAAMAFQAEDGVYGWIDGKMIVVDFDLRAGTATVLRPEKGGEAPPCPPLP